MFLSLTTFWANWRNMEQLWKSRQFHKVENGGSLWCCWSRWLDVCIMIFQASSRWLLMVLSRHWEVWGLDTVRRTLSRRLNTSGDCTRRITCTTCAMSRMRMPDQSWWNCMASELRCSQFVLTTIILCDPCGRIFSLCLSYDSTTVITVSLICQLMTPGHTMLLAQHISPMCLRCSRLIGVEFTTRQFKRPVCKQGWL